MSKNKHKLLILAGGGFFGIIIAKFLSYVEQNFVQQINCLSGCSIGGILASCYASGAKPKDVLQAFKVGGQQIFHKRLVSKFNPLASPTYDNEKLKQFIESFCGDKTLGDIKNKYPHLQVVIPTLNLTDDNYKVWRNFVQSDCKIPLKTLSLMTSAAPTYFDGVQWQGKCYVDGGMIQVTSVLTAATAVKDKLGIPFHDMDVLVMGTGSLIDKQPITYSKYSKFNQLDVCLKVVVPYVTLSNQLASKYWAKQLGFNSFEFFNPIQIWGGLDQTHNKDIMLQDCQMYKNKFLIAWQKFLS